MHCSIFFLYFLIKVSHCCVPLLNNPTGGTNGSGNGNPEPSNATPEPSTSVPSTPVEEKAETTFNIQHKNQYYSCSFQFSFILQEGFHIQDTTNSECTKTSSSEDSITEFLGRHDFVISTAKKFDVSCSLNAVYEEKDGDILLVNTVIQQSMTCFPSTGQCLTEDGPDFPNTCSFPFIAQDRIYQGCTDLKDGIKEDRLWCATETLEDKTMVPGKWSWCNDVCGYCGGKRIEPSNTSPNISSTTTTEAPTECKTVTGKTCKFPFKDGEKEYSECADFRDLYQWCAVTTNPDGTFSDWEKCDKALCTVGGAGECKTVSGPDAFKPCVFPFKDGSVEYTNCAPWRSQFWCATSVSSNGEYETYGYCPSDGTCPLFSMTRGTKDELECAYNCFLNPKKDMVSFTDGVSKDLLLSPTPIVGDLTAPAWNILPKQTFQFLIGQKGIELQCPLGTTFSKFPGESRVAVSCTGEYRFSVRGLTTGINFEGEKNVNFGCIPCPVNYTPITGYIYDSLGLAVYNFVTSLANCEMLCEKMKDCQVFQFNGEKKQCSLQTKDGYLSYASRAGYQVCKSKKHKCTTPLISKATRSPEQESVHEGELVKYECDSKAEMIGDSALICTNNGFVKPLPSCKACCKTITFTSEFGDPYPESEYYDKYIIHSDRKNGHVWYMSESNFGKFSIWKEKDLWILGETDTGKVEAQLSADGCPSDPDNANAWQWITGKTKSGQQRVNPLSSCTETNALVIWTLPVGQGDGTFIKHSGSDEVTMVDFGSHGGNPFGEYGKNPKVFKMVVEHIRNQHLILKNIFLTHPDADHSNWILDLIKQVFNTAHGAVQTVPINVYAGGKKYKWDKALSGLKTLARDNKVLPIYYVAKDPTLDMEATNQLKQVVNPPLTSVPIGTDGATMDIITAGLGGTANQDSMVMKLKYGPKSMLFLGDLQDEPDKVTQVFPTTMPWPTLKSNEIQDCDVVMVPHHGSSCWITPTEMENFYKIVKPKYAIISSHVGAVHHHPKLSIIESICKAQGGTVSESDPSASHPLTEDDPQGWTQTDGKFKKSVCNMPPVFPPATPIVQTKIFQTTKKVGTGTGETLKAYMIKTVIKKDGSMLAPVPVEIPIP